MRALNLDKKSTPSLTLCLISLFLIIHSGKLCHGVPIVSPSDTSVIEGNGAILSCEFQWDPSLAGISCSWSRDGTQIDVTSFSGVYEWTGDPQSGNCSLRIIKSLLERDQGSWRCQLPATSTQSGDVSSPAKLTVEVQPSDPLLIKTNQSTSPIGNIYSIFENETAFITCFSHHGNPVPNLSWIFNSEDLDATKDISKNDDLRKLTYRRDITLEKKFNKDDNGKILRCDLKHDSLNNTEHYVETQLDIQYSTTVVQILSPNYVLVDEGSGYSFACKADGNPAASCEWLFMKTDNADWNVVSENCQYEIAAASQANVGKYMCLAGNNEKMKPSSEIQFDLRDGTKSIVGIIAGVFGAILVIAVVVLTIVVIKLRRRMKAKISNEIPRLPSMADLNKIEVISSRSNTMRDTTYMIPVPTELAPLRPGPPFYDESAIYRNKSRGNYDKNASLRSRGTQRSAESNIYSEPHLYEEIIDHDKNEDNSYDRKDNSTDKEENIYEKKDDIYEENPNEIKETDC